VNSYSISNILPRYENKLSLVKPKQNVYDIIKEILEAHKHFAKDYDAICEKFDDTSTKKICDRLYKFLKKNVPYEMEPEARQTSKSPAAILSTKSDCKHYASFAGGCLDGLNRKGKKINWCYRFASYDFFNKDPEHVFIVVKNNDGEIWIDPTPGAEKVKPTWQIDKKINCKTDMALYRLSGTPVAEVNYLITDIYDENDPNLINAISQLMQYGVMNDQGKINTQKLINLQLSVDPAIYQQLIEARRIVQSAAVGSIFSKVFKGVKTVALSAPRAAYLSLVALNVFGLARKLFAAIYTDESGTTFRPQADKVKKKWESLGGAWTKLLKAVKSGYKKKAILGTVYESETRAAINGPEIPAWVAIAGAIIAAMTPLITGILKEIKSKGEPNYAINPETGIEDPDPQPVPAPAGAAEAGGGAMDFIKSNPLLIVGGLAAIYFLTKKK